MTRFPTTPALATLAAALFLTNAPPVGAGTLEWVRQFGTPNFDRARGVSADRLGNVYISGMTGNVSGAVNDENADAFVAKYDAAGSLQWTRQLGTITVDGSTGASADGLGNVYIAGETRGSLGGPHAGGFTDAWVAKYDAAGDEVWIRQLGSSANESANSVSADGLGNVYITGNTSGSLGGPHGGGVDAWLAKYDAAGDLLWTRQFGASASESSSSVSADVLGNVYIAGTISTGVGVADAYVAKYDADGTHQWIRPLGTTAADFGTSVAVDGLGNIYISGWTYGTLGGPLVGAYNAFVAKYDAAGDLLWTRQFGAGGGTKGYDVSADGLGNVYITGYTSGSLGGPFAGSAGSTDAYVAKYDAAGDQVWIRQLGTTSNDISYRVSADGLGNVYVAGDTDGSLGTRSAGKTDAWVAKFAAPLPGDFNADGVVDGSDFLAWQRGLGTFYTADDLQTWKAHFGAPAGGAAAGAPGQGAVPEPAALPLVLTAALAAGLRRRRPSPPAPSPRRARAGEGGGAAMDDPLLAQPTPPCCCARTTAGALGRLRVARAPLAPSPSREGDPCPLTPDP